MENPQYNSLTEKLIQNGIISASDDAQNLFGIIPDEDMSHSPFVEKPIEAPKAEIPEIKEEINRKRLNNYDLELLKDNKEKTKVHQSFKIIKRFLNFKENMAQKGQSKLSERFFFTFFPKLYKAKLVKDAMAKLNELNIDTKTLLDKTIPYGEGENRYKNLIKYLNYANEIQTNLKKKIN